MSTIKLIHHSCILVTYIVSIHLQYHSLHILHLRTSSTILVGPPLGLTQYDLVFNGELHIMKPF